MQDFCGVPGCPDKKGERFEDVCTDHGRHKPISGIPQNDGVLDWLVIELMVEGTMDPGKGTWLERDIAAAILLAQGHMTRTIRDRSGVQMEGERRCAELGVMAAALREGTPEYGPVHQQQFELVLRGRGRSRKAEAL